MVIYMHHPKHGQKVACSEQEAAADEKNGWLRGVPPAPAPAPKRETLTLQKRSA